MYKDSELLYQYKNGNYTVRIFKDGTKERFTIEDEFIPEFPESIDLKITNYCDLGCPMCHESSSLEGSHASLDALFLNTIHEGTELAIGGGNPLSHPDLIPFLKRMKEQGVISNITINEKHLLTNLELVDRLMKEELIHGLGISISLYSSITNEFIKNHPNAVSHLILGIHKLDDVLSKLDDGIKVLFLGYKKFGRGEKYYSSNIEKEIEYTQYNFRKVMKKFSYVAFDNLALKQLRAKENLPRPLYNRFYMGDDGVFTMYVDLVKKEFALSSTSKERYPLLENSGEMLNFLKK